MQTGPRTILALVEEEVVKRVAEGGQRQTTAIYGRVDDSNAPYPRNSLPTTRRLGAPPSVASHALSRHEALDDMLKEGPRGFCICVLMRLPARKDKVNPVTAEHAEQPEQYDGKPVTAANYE